MKRNATAVWEGSGKEGKGNLTTQSTTLNNTQYSFGSRFAEGVGTNPEELIAAAHSGCFTMKLSFNIDEAGFTAEKLETKCEINLDPSKGEIVESHLTLTATVPGLSKEKFDELVADAEKNCPISKLLNTKITVDATLA
ncbi:OsmC family protein [Pedobacter sp. Leaf176]|uniref:OsmC family protein n=1 Tax=Pedobacter sp. Leaf176 TaxID=1736286 RepID=UPI0006FD8D6D|nr:OsmC family protein [Pedobacter sp. Leaf176]KQR72397.1 peroxiredoxin [Pedobacter sp. Leaf176]